MVASPSPERDRSEPPSVQRPDAPLCYGSHQPRQVKLVSVLCSWVLRSWAILDAWRLDRDRLTAFAAPIALGGVFAGPPSGYSAPRTRHQDRPRTRHEAPSTDWVFVSSSRS